MNFKKIVATLAAAALSVSALSVSAMALSTKDYLKDGVVYVNADKPEDPTWAIDAGVAQTDVYGVTFHVTFEGNAEWYGGGIGANSNSTGWKSIEWGTNSKEITAAYEEKINIGQQLFDIIKIPSYIKIHSKLKIGTALQRNDIFVAVAVAGHINNIRAADCLSVAFTH